MHEFKVYICMCELTRKCKQINVTLLARIRTLFMYIRTCAHSLFILLANKTAAEVFSMSIVNLHGKHTQNSMHVKLEYCTRRSGC